mgnify:FL=1
MNIEPQRLFGQPGLGFHRLGISIKLKVPSKKIDAIPPTMHPADVISDIYAEIHVHGNRAGDHLLGVARPENPQTIVLRQRSSESQTIFYLELDRARVDAVEELRQGEDLWFRPVWRCTVNGQDGPLPCEDSSSLEYHANQSTWLTVLREMNYRASLLFEIPIPNDNGASLREAVKLLRAAEEDYRANRNEDAIGDCRKALEQFATTFDVGELEKAKQLYGKGGRDDGPNRRDMTVEQRFLIVYETLRHVTHPAMHAPGEQAGAKFTRRDAAAIIALSAVLLSRALAH